MTRVLLRLPDRLRDALDSQHMERSGPLDTMSLDVAEELLLAIDTILGDGSGRTLEEAGADLTSWSLIRGTTSVVAGDLRATLARQQTALERPFSDVAVRFDLQPRDAGLHLTVGVHGRPRATKIFRHLTVGTIKASDRFARATNETLKITSDTIGDRAVIAVWWKNATAQPDSNPHPIDDPVSPRSSSRSFRPPRLADEVDRIMTHAGLTSAPPRSRADISANERRTLPAARRTRRDD